MSLSHPSNKMTGDSPRIIGVMTVLGKERSKHEGFIEKYMVHKKKHLFFLKK
jgi:hypothetical protein